MAHIRKIFHRLYCTESACIYEYFMKVNIRDSFYHANASLNDHINWFVQSAHELVFPVIGDNYETHLKETVRCESMLKSRLRKADDVLQHAISVMEPCKMLIDIHFPIGSDRIEPVRGFMAQHNIYDEDVNCLGGLHISNDITRDSIKAMAILSSYRHALYNMDIGGACFGIKACSDSFESQAMQILLHKFIRVLESRTSRLPQLNIIEPDLYTNNEHMDFISELNNESLKSSFISVGKTVPNGGLPNYNEAGAKAVLYFLRDFLDEDEIAAKLEIETGVANKTFILEGLGKLGQSIGMLMEESSAICVGIKERDCSIYDQGGIDINAITQYKLSYGTLIGFNDKVVPKDSPQIFGETCDIMIFAATHRTLQCYNADKIQAKVIVEAANFALTPSAHKKLINTGKLVIPDLMAGAGPTILSYIEYLRNYDTAKFNKLKSRFIRMNPNITEYELIDEIFESMLETTLSDIWITRNKYNLAWNFKIASFATAIHNMFFKNKFRLEGITKYEEKTSIMQ